MTILDILNELAADASGNAKKAILLREKDNELLKKVIAATYNPFVNYWIKKRPAFSVPVKPALTLDQAIDELALLANRTHTGNAGIAHLQYILENLPIWESAIITRIIDRDLRCGFSTTTANKIWPGLLPTFEVMLAYKDTSGIKYPAYSQVKYDGGRCHLYFDGTKATAWSRNGKEIELCGALDSSAQLLMKAGETWDGEIVFREAGTSNLLDRKTSNGHFNRGVKGTLTPEIAEDITFIAWDIVDTSSTIRYRDRVETYIARWNKLNETKKHESKIWVAEALTVNSEEEAIAHYAKCIKHGHEGSIVKNIDAVWQPKRTKDLGKLKAVEDCSLRVVGWEEGSGKYVGMMGALIGESEDGKVRVRVGTGFSDQQRMAYTEANTMGKIFDAQYNQLIKSKGKEQHCLFLPRFIEFREDKTEADNFGQFK